MIALSDADERMLSGADGAATAFAMRLVVQVAEAMGAARLLDIVSGHIDGCLYHGRVSLDFVEHLIAGGGKVRVPTTLNVGSMDLIHPELFRGDEAAAAAARRLMTAHEALGCVPTFSCAPYQSIFRPRLGDQIAWGESNAIVFANSVIGARTNRYGDFIDLAAAITGRAPAVGMHLEESRRGEVVFEITAVLQGSFLDTGVLAVTMGAIIGARAGGRVPVIVGLPAATSEDDLKALGATAASAGAIALFHAVGLTPEAPSLDAALQGEQPVATIAVDAPMLQSARDRLSTVPPGTPIAAVSIGTPHASEAECNRLLACLSATPPRIDVYLNTSRATLARLSADGRSRRLEALGVTIVVDTCTYVTSIMRRLDAPVMTPSGKWAWYAPGNLGIEVAFGSLAECVASAAAGRVVRL